MLLFCHLGHSHREKWMGGWLDGERERQRGRLTNWTVLRMCGNKVSDNREYTTSVSLRLLVSGFLGGSVVKNACNAGDPRSIPESGRTPEEGNGYPLQYSCLEKPMDRGAWWAKSMGPQRVRHNWATFLPPPPMPYWSLIPLPEFESWPCHLLAVCLWPSFLISVLQFPYLLISPLNAYSSLLLAWSFALHMVGSFHF